MSFQLSPQTGAPASGAARVSTKGKGVFKRMFRRGDDKEVCRSCVRCRRLSAQRIVHLTMLRNLLKSSTSNSTKVKRYENYLPVGELDLKDPRPMNHNQPIATGIEDVQAVVPHPSAIGIGPRDASGENDTHDVRAHAAAFNADSYRFHQVPENVQPVKVIRDAEEKISTLKSIPGPMETAVNAIAPANTAMAQLDTFNATYLQPLSAFNAVVTGIANVCLPN